MKSLQFQAFEANTVYGSYCKISMQTMKYYMLNAFFCYTNQCLNLSWTVVFVSAAHLKRLCNTVCEIQATQRVMSFLKHFESKRQQAIRWFSWNEMLQAKNYPYKKCMYMPPINKQNEFKALRPMQTNEWGNFRRVKFCART